MTRPISTKRLTFQLSRVANEDVGAVAFAGEAQAMAKILRDAGLSTLIESDAVERLAGGFQFTEGPLWQPDGSLLFQDIKAERTYRLDPDGSVHVVRERTRAANGQTFGTDDSIVFCEQTGRRISRLSLNGGWSAYRRRPGGRPAQQPQ